MIAVLTKLLLLAKMCFQPPIHKVILYHNSIENPLLLSSSLSKLKGGRHRRCLLLWSRDRRLAGWWLWWECLLAICVEIGKQRWIVISILRHLEAEVAMYLRNRMKDLLPTRHESVDRLTEYSGWKIGVISTCSRWGVAKQRVDVSQSHLHRY